MLESEFVLRADTALEHIGRKLDESGADIDWSQAGGVLEIEFSDGSKIVVNRHAVAQEIWVAARSGGFHFRWDGANWRDTRDGNTLKARLAALMLAQGGETVDFD